MKRTFEYETPLDTKIFHTSLVIGMVAVVTFGISAGNFITNITNKIPKLPFQHQQSADTTQASFSDGNSKKWDLIWQQEGTGCQNWSADRQNNGGRWFTCMGVVQRSWTQYVGENPSLNLPARVEVAYKQLGSKEFKKHATKIYIDRYCKPINCDEYKGPMPALLLAISANGGPGVAKRHLKATENISDPKERALAIAKREHARYDRIAANNPSQRGFRRGGWENNIRNRYEYIKGF